MAVRERRELNNHKVQRPVITDKDLSESVNARKTRLAYRNGEVIPLPDRIYEDEKLEIVPDNIKLISYADVSRRSRELMLEHEDDRFRIEKARKARKLTARTAFETGVVVGIIVLAGFFVMMLLFPQTELSELARDNSNLRDDIGSLKTQILDAEEHANGVTDMDTVRAQALALGMQDPNQNQVVNLPVPNNDSLKTVVTYNMDGINDEVIDDAESALAAYYQSHPDA